MILGIDHLALSVTNTDEAKRELEGQNFSCLFLERNVPNNPSKRILLERYEVQHDLGVFRPLNGGISMEITNHGNVFADSVGPYKYQDGNIELRTADAKVETIFWERALRFQEIDNENYLKLSSPVPNWSCVLKVIENKDILPCKLDAKGYPCLALLTNDLYTELDVVKEAGAYDIIEPFKIFINGKNLEIGMFRTPTGTICELIQIGK